jgi:hypothetical protein
MFVDEYFEDIITPDREHRIAVGFCHRRLPAINSLLAS